LTDIQFVLERIVDAAALSSWPRFEHADMDTMTGLLEEFGRFCEEVLVPLNQVGDTVGATYDPATGAVRTAPGWSEAYRKYAEAGWGSVPFPQEHGGGAFPWLLAWPCRRS